MQQVNVNKLIYHWRNLTITINLTLPQLLSQMYELNNPLIELTTDDENQNLE